MNNEGDVMQEMNKVTMPEPTNNYKKERVSRLPTFLAVFIIVAAVLGGVYTFTQRDNILAYLEGGYAADADELASIDENTLNGFSFAFGTEPSDPIDYSTYSLPEPDKALEAEYYRALQTSPAFEWLDNVNEILEYDDFDGDGNIKEEAMINIINIAKESEE